MRSAEALEQAREALFQSQKLQAIGQLTGGIAHDFNNLLTVILGNLEIVRKRMPNEPKLAQLLDNATQGALRGVSLTQRMLAFARRQKLTSEPVELVALVQGISGLLQSSLGPSIHIQAEFAEALSPVLADVNQLELAILNLATNARDAMPQGGRILIQAQERLGDELAAPDRQLAPGRYVCLAITDEGEGMDEATLALAVDPFFTTKGVGKGTGLGLSMVHGLAEQLGGRLILKSAKGVGTTAELWLPVAGDSVAEKPPAMEAAAPPVNGLKVLVVDDDSLVLTSTRLLIEDLGHQVLCASSGVQALELYERFKDFDLVITDMAMPQMDGAQLAKLLRNLQPTLPIILATGYAERLEGFATQLPRLIKPFKQIDLVQVIGQTMK
jgi:nitrogen-specific signal transduction histidine kinase/CheY-like chemotaxis protein